MAVTAGHTCTVAAGSVPTALRAVDAPASVAWAHDAILDNAVTRFDLDDGLLDIIARS